MTITAVKCYPTWQVRRGPSPTKALDPARPRPSSHTPTLPGTGLAQHLPGQGGVRGRRVRLGRGRPLRARARRRGRRRPLRPVPRRPGEALTRTPPTGCSPKERSGADGGPVGCAGRDADRCAVAGDVPLAVLRGRAHPHRRHLRHRHRTLRLPRSALASFPSSELCSPHLCWLTGDGRCWSPGKKLGVPVYQLLGGAHRHHIPCMVSCAADVETVKARVAEGCAPSLAESCAHC